MNLHALIVTDNESQAAVVRMALLQEGLGCPLKKVVSLEQAPQEIASSPVDLIVVGLSADYERSLKTIAWLEKLPRTNGERVLVIGRPGNDKLILRVLRGAADDYLDETDLEAELTAAMDRWRSSRVSQNDTGKVIAVLSPSGGSGTSTLAANLATVLAKQHKSAALIDLNLESGDLAVLLDLKPTYTISDLCHNIARMDKTLFERSLTRHVSGVSLLAAPSRFEDIVQVTPDGVHQTLALARSTFPYVLVDLDHSLRPEQIEVLRSADIVVMVFRLELTSLRNARRMLEHLGGLGVARDRIRLVVNRYGQPKEIPYAKAEEALGMKIFHYVPNDPAAINRSNNAGVPVVIDSPRASVSRSVTKLATSVNGRLPA